MARKKPTQEPSTAPRESVRHVPLEGHRRLYTVAPDDACWRSERSTRPDVTGAIVRMRPPADATDDAIAKLRKEFEQQGAARVFVLPRPRAELLPGKNQVCPGCRDGVGCLFPIKCELPKAKAVGAREAVASLVEESNSKDKDALRTLCEKVMSKVGL